MVTIYEKKICIKSIIYNEKNRLFIGQNSDFVTKEIKHGNSFFNNLSYFGSWNFSLPEDECKTTNVKFSSEAKDPRYKRNIEVYVGFECYSNSPVLQ